MSLHISRWFERSEYHRYLFAKRRRPWRGRGNLKPRRGEDRRDSCRRRKPRVSNVRWSLASRGPPATVRVASGDQTQPVDIDTKLTANLVSMSAGALSTPPLLHLLYTCIKGSGHTNVCRHENLTDE